MPLKKPTYEILENQLADARKIIRALESEQTDAILSNPRYLSLRDKDADHQVRKLNQILEKSLAEKRDKIQTQAKRMQMLAHKLVRVEQDERKELAAILHDQIQPLVIGARMQIWELQRKNNPLATQKIADKIENILVEILEALRSLSVEISPSALQENGVVGGLNWLKTYMADKFEFTVNLFVENHIEPVRDATGYLLFESVKELLLNAAKHAGTSEANISIQRTDAHLISIVVSDQGQGFEPEVINHALKDQTTLGLSSIRERLATINGQMLLETAFGKGTKITLTVPAGECFDQRDEVTESRTEPDLKRDRIKVSSNMIGILIVDDHKVLREGLKGLLQLEPDFHVLAETADGDQAIELARDLKPDVVIMDINLGKTHGVQVTRQILDLQPETCIIGLSMHRDPSVIDAMRQAGAVAYLTKDSPSDELIETIRKYNPREMT